MKPFLRRCMFSRAPTATVLIRILVGAVFLSEGIQKFLFPAALGAGRFAKIGIPWPEVMGPFVGAVEIVAGSLVLLGLLARPAALILLVNISVAIISTKVPILLGRGFWLFSLPSLKSYGFWSMAHEARTDFCMWLGCLFLVITGAGFLSLDHMIAGNLKSASDSKSVD
ncbi:MAG: DoxX family protein [Candidatus Glassbacteria bacterium RIFCSPLOWO2_12_FULL_58_11]|uniref:DoxX family protein n=1 Tax=Candidatus Glassbacteria bacterium RIFCSPLOWO2_12_FULL_58_11 TaxID=1817867 RepID=A0A1F5YJU5_9BACT|nr:MAG: DoxX family protein [Candidatus Glassbacteria bacterium RIFCSPLOWO2_12_FULL_58_11]